MRRNIDTATRFWFGNYRPPGWGEIQGRLVAYASDAIVTAYEESGNADNEAVFRFDVWKSTYNRMLKENPELEFSDDDPRQVDAKSRLRDMEQKANEKDQVLIDLIRSELHSRPTVGNDT